MHQLRPFVPFARAAAACSATAHSQYARITVAWDEHLHESLHPTVMLRPLLNNNASVSVMRRIVWGNAHSSSLESSRWWVLGLLVSRAQVYVRFYSP